MLPRPFSLAGDTLRFASPGATSVRQAFTSFNPRGEFQAMISNLCGQTIVVAFGGSGVTAPGVTTPGRNYVIPSGFTGIVTAPAGATHVAINAAAASTGDVFITPGFGTTVQ